MAAPPTKSICHIVKEGRFGDTCYGKDSVLLTLGFDVPQTSSGRTDRATFVFDRIFDWGLSAMSPLPTLIGTTLLRHRLNQLENGWHGSFASWMAALNGNDDIEGFLTSA